MANDKMFFLHHYEASPYAEKIRLMFGLTDHPWASVLSPPYPPRPNLQPLVGDFRRIPVAHYGADIFCDTTLIAEEVAALTRHAELAPIIEDPGARSIAERAEGEVFFCAITAAPPLPLLGKLILGNGIGGALKFVKDRTAMMKNSSLSVPQGKAAAAVLEEFLTALEAYLAGRDVIHGDQISYADFCVYHPLWLALSVGGLKSLKNYDNVRIWYERVAGLGQGPRAELGAEEALDAVAAAEPRALPEGAEEHDALGRAATIAPADYGTVGVAGTLVAVDEHRYILARDTERCGTAHLHFPREGYSLSV